MAFHSLDDFVPESHFAPYDARWTMCGLSLDDDLVISPTPTCQSCQRILEDDARMLAQLLEQDVMPQADGVLRLMLSASVLAAHLREAVLSAVGDELSVSYAELSVEQKEFWSLRAKAVLEMFVTNPKTTEQFNRDVQRTLKLVK